MICATGKPERWLDVTLQASVKPADELNSRPCCDIADKGRSMLGSAPIMSRSWRPSRHRSTLIVLVLCWLLEPGQGQQLAPEAAGPLNRALAELGKLIEEPVEPWMVSQLANLTTDRNTSIQDRAEVRRQVILENGTVFSATDQINERLKATGMRLAKEAVLKGHREFKLVIAYNETSVLLAKKTNIYFYWEVSKAPISAHRSLKIRNANPDNANGPPNAL